AIVACHHLVYAFTMAKTIYEMIVFEQKYNTSWAQIVLVYIFLHTINVNGNSSFMLIHYYKFATWKRLEEIRHSMKWGKSDLKAVERVNSEIRKLALVN